MFPRALLPAGTELGLMKSMGLRSTREATPAAHRPAWQKGTGPSGASASFCPHACLPPCPPCSVRHSDPLLGNLVPWQPQWPFCPSSFPVLLLTLGSVQFLYQFPVLSVGGSLSWAVMVTAEASMGLEGESCHHQSSVGAVY